MRNAKLYIRVIFIKFPIFDLLIASKLKYFVLILMRLKKQRMQLCGEQGKK